MIIWLEQMACLSVHGLIPSLSHEERQDLSEFK